MPRSTATIPILALLLTVALAALGESVSIGAPQPGGQLTVSPDPVPLGTDTLVISGSGFAANKYVVITVSGALPGAEATTNGSGAFQITWTRWGGGFNGVGDHWVTASDSRGNQLAVKHFQVVDGDSDGDGDGFLTSVEYYLGTNASKACATSAGDIDSSGSSRVWPGDLYAAGASYNTVDIQDLIRFVAPDRLLDTNVSATSRRLDVEPGKGAFATDINIQDLATVSTFSAPMFGGARAFDHAPCSP